MCGIALPGPCEGKCPGPRDTDIVPHLILRSKFSSAPAVPVSQSNGRQVKRLECEFVGQSSFCLTLTLILFKDPTAKILSGSSPSCSP